MPDVGKYYWVQLNSGEDAQPAKYAGPDSWHLLDGAPTSVAPNWISSEAVAPTPPPPPGSTPIYDFDDYRDTRGRTPVDPAIFQQPGTMILGIDGQSMVGNYAQITGTCWAPNGTQEMYEYDVWTDAIYRIDQNVIMGAGRGFGGYSVVPIMLVYGLGVAAQRILIGCSIQGGTSAAEWAPPANKPWYNRRKTLIQRLRSHGLEFNRWLSVQGQADVPPLGAPDSAAQPAATAVDYSSLRAWGFQDSLRSEGYTGPIYIGKGCHWATNDIAYPSRYAMVRSGQDHLANRTDVGEIHCYGDDDIYSASQYRAPMDNTHWSMPLGAYYWQTLVWSPNGIASVL